MHITPIVRVAALVCGALACAASLGCERRIIRKEQPRNTRAPVIMMKPRTKRIAGEEPAVALKSLRIKAVTVAPRMMPMISGRMYWTGAALCSLKMISRNQ